MYTQVAVYWRVKMTDTHTHAHPYPRLDLACTNRQLRARPLKDFQEYFHYRHAISYLPVIWLMMADTHTHTLAWLLTQTHTPHGAFFFDTYRSVSLTCMQCYTQLAFLFHQCGTSFLSKDDRIADCTVRYPGVERPFYSFNILVYRYV